VRVIGLFCIFIFHDEVGRLIIESEY